MANAFAVPMLKGMKSAPRRRTGRRPTALQLGLSARGRRGGMRAGAGRKRIPREKRGYVPHLTRPKVVKSTPVHVTMRCVAGLPSLRRRTHQRVIEAVFARENRKGFRLVHYSIQGNHLHLICEGDSTEALSRGIQRVASLLARRMNRRFKRSGPFFHERYDGKVIKTPKQMRHALRYVLLNHHKHALETDGAFVDGLDGYSSASFFDGWSKYRRKCRPPPPQGAPVVPARCWLITTGWRRYGRLAPNW